MAPRLHCWGGGVDVACWRLSVWFFRLIGIDPPVLAVVPASPGRYCHCPTCIGRRSPRDAPDPARSRKSLSGISAMVVSVFTHPDCLRHDPGADHPETPARLRAILDRLKTQAGVELREAA